jgi:regulator of protease activity HflC (stomatin/prohibitin superfamily)
MNVMSESIARTRAGVPWLVGNGVAAVVSITLFVLGLVNENIWSVVVAIVIWVIATIIGIGFYMVQPNQAVVVTLFGDYRGTDRTPGLRIANPLYRKRKISERVRNFTTATSKVNDANGNPIEIAAVVVWRVTDTARAVFGVDDFTSYVETQSESAVRQLARSYPYDNFEDDAVTTLIGDTSDVNEDLMVELQERASEAGVEIIESRITDLAYAPEIAEAMLRRQQASAIVAARMKIVEGAVLMVQEAIAALERGSDGHDSIPLDNDRKATFASNLMTVIASDNPTAPVVNVGTLSR